MVHTDFTKVLVNGQYLKIPCDVYNTYSKAVNIKRTGWINSGMPAPESIVEHMYNTWLFGLLNLPEIYETEMYDKTKIFNMIMIHDLAEAVTGDIPKPQKIGDSSYDDNEDSIMRAFLLKGTYPGMTNLKEYYILWEEWFKQESFNSHVAKDLDLLQAMYQFCVYFLKYPDKFSDERRYSWLNEYQDIKTDIGLELYERLIRNNPDFIQIFDMYPI